MFFLALHFRIVSHLYLDTSRVIFLQKTTYKPKVLLLLHTLNLSGAPKIALDALEQMSSQVRVRTLSLDGGPMEERCRGLGQLNLLHDPKRNRLFRRVDRTLGTGKRLLELSLRRWKPDVIYVNSIAALEIVRALRLPRAPSLLHVHELETAFDYFAPLCDRFVEQWPQRYIAVSNPVRALLRSRYNVEASKISLVYEFVRDADFHAPCSPRTRIDARFVVGGAGTPNWRKGTSQWLETAAELRRLVGEDNIRFVWVGVRDDFDSMDFRNESRRRKLEKVIEFIPATKEPFNHFASFDVFAMTSWEDPCPVVVLENMMLKNPVLCFAGSGGAPEEVGDTGIVVDDFSPVAMAQEIARLMVEPERVRELGERARMRVESHFTASQQVPRILEIIQDLAASPGRTQAARA